jgi:hypothetical protein
MLSVLGFKRLLFAGVLDSWTAGESQVFLGGSRLKRFMESVENATAGVPAPSAEEAPEPAAVEPAVDETLVDGDGDAIAAAQPIADPLSGLLRTGLELLTQLTATAATEQTAALAPPRVFERIRDGRTGQSYLKIRMPQPEVMDRVAGASQALPESLRA